MTTRRPPAHVLIWRDPTGGANAGAGPMFGWQEYRRPDHGTLFQKRGDPGWIGSVAARVLSADFGAIMRNTNVTVAWQPERPDATPAAELEPIFRRVQPMTLICPQRPAISGRSPISARLKFCAGAPSRLRSTIWWPRCFPTGGTAFNSRPAD